ncbi:hypothetical protein Q3G72_024907 [Acer saccharum]|nr:hypothetical protein Q3G72_024907 [Acer saccharum]
MTFPVSVVRVCAHLHAFHSSGDDFLSRFIRNANLVASGVAMNMPRLTVKRKQPRNLCSFIIHLIPERETPTTTNFIPLCGFASRRTLSFDSQGFEGKPLNCEFNSITVRDSNGRCCGLQISQLVNSNGKRLFLVDTLALVRRLEAQGLPSNQAEAITAAITEVLTDSLENVSHSVVTKGEMQKSELIQESSLSKFKSEVQNLQEHHFSLLQHETEKLRNDIEKMRNELRYEIDKVTAGQRLDLNLERGRTRDELANQNVETSNLTNKLDREIHALRAQLEAAKYDVIKYCIGSLVSISAFGLAVVRIFM